MSILAQINYINNELVKGNTIANIYECIEKNSKHEIISGGFNNKDEKLEINKGA
ncbi:hypothetical protein K9O30_02815 [Clostridium bowmanii]|uniref:hypothetical protein n=1 Tax=Clostridium bowmanii TaxID=132925 RepID=UPI001C0AE7F5|nr:hypothetical protein [Clostridium bowmanii]MBU3188300.1 hypothetical protein [Clostridium bowmanii]MCA1072688.1 hypothetical protein [Clostridium bowmanii]